jgi:mediator of RNA polymerase II transcription subunit 12
MGQDPEDKLSVESIKYGFSDKQVLGNEYQTARASLWPIIKNKGGLRLLSTLHAKVLKERQSVGRIKIPTTFKPPPRVTLTDTKREAWLRDLGDENVPLRRLSRTIPHGIRGKSLLEQCLSKGISVERGVWLAKCVGANEIRAFRRKGIGTSVAIGGELKWIREWTLHVEQFLDGVIATCGEVQWRKNMTYA